MLDGIIIVFATLWVWWNIAFRPEHVEEELTKDEEI